MAKRGGLGRGLDALIPAGGSSRISRAGDSEKSFGEKKNKNGSGKKGAGKAAAKAEKQKKEKKVSVEAETAAEVAASAAAAAEALSELQAAASEKEKQTPKEDLALQENPDVSGAEQTAPNEDAIENDTAVENEDAVEHDTAIETVDNIETKNSVETDDAVTSDVNNPLAKTPSEGMNAEGEVISMRLSLIEPNREQPRKYFNDEKIDELADSVRQFGIIQPLLVQKKDDYYEIIAGERRWRAAKKAGLREVPVIIKNFSSQEAVEISLIENIQREDLNPIEEAKAYNRLVREYGMNQEEVANRVSKSRSAVTNSLRLLKLDEDLQKMVETSELSEGHARALLGAPAGEMQKMLAEKVLKEKLSVRQTEKLVRDTMNPVEKRKRRQDVRMEAMLQELSENLKTALGTKVSIRQSGKNKGKIEIEYYSEDELDRLYELLRSV